MSVKDMTDQQLNRAIGELMGYSMKNTNTTKVYYRLVDPTGQLIGNSCASERGVWSLYGPRYCTDPAASLEVQAKAIEVGAVKYMAHLVYCTGHNYHDGLTMDTARDMLLATSRQRAEAAYITLSSQD